MPRRLPLLPLAAAVWLLAPGAADARWVPDASKGRIPASPAAGLILGRPFRVGKAELKVSPPVVVPLPPVASGPPQTSKRVNYTLVLAHKGSPAAQVPDGCTLFLTLPHNQKLDGRSFVVGPKGVFAMEGKLREKTTLYPPIQGMMLSANPKGKSAPLAETPRKYTLRLEFGKAQKGRIPGRIYLAAQDKGKSWALGTFTAAITRGS